MRPAPGARCPCFGNFSFPWPSRRARFTRPKNPVFLVLIWFYAKQGGGQGTRTDETSRPAKSLPRLRGWGTMGSVASKELARAQRVCRKFGKET
jgi:hypothetical protein